MKLGQWAPLVLAGALLGGCSTIASIGDAVGLESKPEQTQKRLRASVMPRDPQGFLQHGMDRIAATRRPADQAAFDAFLRDGVTGDRRRFDAAGKGRPFTVVIGGATYLVASGAECRNLEISTERSSAVDGVACTLSGSTWRLLKPLIGG